MFYYLPLSLLIASSFFLIPNLVLFIEFKGHLSKRTPFLIGIPRLTSIAFNEDRSYLKLLLEE